MVPPKLPKSIILPSFHKKVSTVGTLVEALGVKLVYDSPTITLRGWPLQLEPGTASGPPNVPISRITPFSQRNVWICVPVKKKEEENGSGTPLSENPITCPLSLI